MQHGQSPFEDDPTIAIKPRDFICPCGKSYLSYAALFTHIKQKHEGKAPGKIIKPPSLHQKRGRPPVRAKNIPPPSPPPHPPNQDIYPPETPEEEVRRQGQAEQVLDALAQFLNQMPQETLNKTHLNELEAFAEMSVRLNTRTELSYPNGTICLADGLLEFCRGICLRLDWWQFQTLYLLFMLFLQYIVDDQNNKALLTQGTLDLICQGANEFIEEHLKQMSGYYGVSNLWLLQRQNTIATLSKFFNWCSYKHFITYSINVSDNRSNQGTQSEQMRP